MTRDRIYAQKRKMWSRAARTAFTAASRGPFILRLAVGSAVAVGVAAGASRFGHDRSWPLGLSQRWILHAEAAPIPDVPRGGSDGFREDPDTSMPFPLTLTLNASATPLSLVGVGVRKVSFLKVKVYSAGFYVDESTLKTLSSTPGWHSFSAVHLMTAPTKENPLEAPQLTGEALVKQLLDRQAACAVRIVPVRNTDFGHLRDGFTRAVLARQKAARTAGLLTEADETRIATSLQDFKALFPAQTVPKGKSLVLLRAANGDLVVEYENKVLGSVRDPWVSRELMLAYFADKDVISPKLKEDVAKGFESFIKA